MSLANEFSWLCDDNFLREIDDAWTPIIEDLDVVGMPSLAEIETMTIPLVVPNQPPPVPPAPPAPHDLVAKGPYQLRVKTAMQEYPIAVRTKEWDLWSALTVSNQKKLAEHRSQCWVMEPGWWFPNEAGEGVQQEPPTWKYFDLKVYQVDQSVIDKLSAAKPVDDSGVLIKLRIKGSDQELSKFPPTSPAADSMMISN